MVRYTSGTRARRPSRAPSTVFSSISAVVSKIVDFKPVLTASHVQIVDVRHARRGRGCPGARRRRRSARRTRRRRSRRGRGGPGCGKGAPSLVGVFEWVTAGAGRLVRSRALELSLHRRRAVGSGVVFKRLDARRVPRSWRSPTRVSAAKVGPMHIRVLPRRGAERSTRQVADASLYSAPYSCGDLRVR